MAFKLNPAAFAKRAPLPAPRVIEPHAPDFAAIVSDETRLADGAIAATDSVIDGVHEPVIVSASESNIKGEAKLSRLVDDDFPFDETQLAAVYGIVKERYACMTGAAGTGKTTTTKKIVDELQDSLDHVDMSTYWKRGAPADDDDDYEIPEDLIPSIALVSFTGRATQMIKKNFPRDWHGNIMTIHRLLGFVPDFYEDFDEESQQMRKKMRFIPTYNAETKMPWDIIVIDEAGMLGLDLWNDLYAALKPGCRIIMIGDINQLPPTHGKSIFGFALSTWPSWELTHVHRQQGANNSIVDNAHRVLRGLTPVSDCPSKTANLKTQEGIIEALNWMVKDKDWRFAMFEVDEDSRKASLRIRQVMKLLQHKIYEPNRDAIITPINGFESTATGYMLGQEPMNRELAISLNAGQDRYIIDGGRDRKNFAIGDKVMATRNDYEAGITNGMTGIIESIAEHGGYQGDARRWGRIKDVQEYINSLEEDMDDGDFSLEELSQAHEEQEEGAAAAKEGRDRGPSSHIVTVRFGEGEHSFTIPFSSLAEVASLMIAYTVTCHKMQGGEAPFIAVICHQSHKRPLNREWLYTAITRASGRCVVFYTKQGRGFALTKQNIKGSTLEQKVAAFQALQKVGIAGASVKVRIQQPESMSKELSVANPRFQAPSPAERMNKIMEAVESKLRPEPLKQKSKLDELIGKTIHVTIRHEHTVSRIVDAQPAESKPIIDGGELKSEPTYEDRWDEKRQTGLAKIDRLMAPIQALPAPAKLIPQYGAYRAIQQQEDLKNQKLLTYQPAPEPKKLTGLAALIAKQKEKQNG